MSAADAAGRGGLGDRVSEDLGVRVIEEVDPHFGLAVARAGVSLDYPRAAALAKSGLSLIEARDQARVGTPAVMASRRPRAGRA